MLKRGHAVDMPMTNRAIAFAAEKHDGQTRDVSGLLYLVHPIMVMGYVLKYKDSEDIDILCAAAILHDVREDCGVTHKELVKGFNVRIANLVDELTNDEVEMKRMGKKRYLDRKLSSMTSYALVIKLADMLANTTENPRQEAMQRMVHHCRNLLVVRENRLSLTHRRLISEILWNAERLYGVK